MFDNKPTETQYIYTDDDSAGARLDGTESYEITFAPGQEPPVSGFWSMTLYNNDHASDRSASTSYSFHRFLVEVALTGERGVNGNGLPTILPDPPAAEIA